MEQLKQRYAPGRRENSFFIDTPFADESRRRSSSSPENVFDYTEYTYYVDSDGSLIKEKMR